MLPISQKQLANTSIESSNQPKMTFNSVRRAYILYNSFGALQSDVDVTEDRNGHSFYEVRQIRMTSLQVFQLTVPWKHTHTIRRWRF